MLRSGLQCVGRMLSIALLAVALSACHSTGNRYSILGEKWLQPGITTAADARVFLEGNPVNVYRQSDGSSLQVWQHGQSLFPDGVYYHNELWLEFDQQDTLRRVVKRK